MRYKITEEEFLYPVDKNLTLKVFCNSYFEALFSHSSMCYLLSCHIIMHNIYTEYNIYSNH